ncbi:MAG: glycosyltransferase family 1 protein, partial [Prevotella sp.]|nr:glycosyltransferase family 1 protein [Prevotella sp.]
MKDKMRIAFDAKRIVQNGTGLGSYGRTLVNDLSKFDDLDLTLYAPNKGRDDLRQQIAESDRLRFFFPHEKTAIGKAFWRSFGIVNQLQKDNIQVYHGLSGELPFHIKRTGIKSVVTIHDLIFLRHPEFY